jgi:ABC-type multidrug transport system fused ATPase/permease subunit
MIEAIQELYTKRINEFSEKLKAIENKIRIVSYSRVFLALAAVFCFYFALTKSTDYFFMVLLLILVFVSLVFVHTKLFKRRDLLRNLVLINNQELKYLEQDYSSFNPGNEFIDNSHPYTFDLDIFGAGSLYQSLSRNVTYSGRKLLAQTLSENCLSVQEISTKQQSVKELKEKLDFRQKFQATGLMLTESPSDREKFNQWLKEDFYFLKHGILSIIIYLLPALSLIFLIISIIQSEFHAGLALTILFNWIVYGSNLKKITRLYSLVSKKKILLDSYSGLFKIVDEEIFKSPELVEVSASIRNASGQFKKLADYVGWFDQRLNIFVSPVLNSLFLYDLQLSLLIERWRSKNDKHMLVWMNTLGKLDVLCSLGNFHYNNPDFCFPELSDSGLAFKAYGLGHPLIRSNKRVPNDFELGGDHHIAIITGANMAGKSTFLRVVGINIALAYTGAPVCATGFKATMLELMSSMRISDSLKDDVSYFYAELQRLKLIRQKVESGHPTFILLDEMLRGTNSKDKQQGSKAFVENLLEYNCLALVATHDLMLGELHEQYPSKIENFSFESILIDNELRFDYKIRPGIAKNTNASFLMRKLGII